MAWCRQATSHYLSQSWPRYLSPYGIIRGQWVKSNTSLLHENVVETANCENVWHLDSGANDLYTIMFLLHSDRKVLYWLITIHNACIHQGYWIILWHWHIMWTDSTLAAMFCGYLSRGTGHILNGHISLETFLSYFHSDSDRYMACLGSWVETMEFYGQNQLMCCGLKFFKSIMPVVPHDFKAWWIIN